MRLLVWAVAGALVLVVVGIGGAFWDVGNSSSPLPTARPSVALSGAGRFDEPIQVSAATPIAKSPQVKLEHGLVPPLSLDDPETAAEADEFAAARGPGPLDLFIADDFSHDSRAAFHPHGKKFCASGCTVSNHPTGELTESRFDELLAQFADEPMDESSLALESLLYFGRQTRRLLARDGVGPLDAERAELLLHELGRSHARIAIRVVDERGVVRASLPPTRVPLDRRHVFEMDVSDVQPLVTSGTVKRVGLNHVWVRL